MKTIYTEITIAVPVSRVWDVLTDFGAYPQWNPFIREIKGNPQRGEKLTVTITPPGQKPRSFKPTIISVIPNTELSWLGHVLLPGIFDGEHLFIMKKNADK